MKKQEGFLFYAYILSSAAARTRRRTAHGNAVVRVSLYQECHLMHSYQIIAFHTSFLLQNSSAGTSTVHYPDKPTACAKRICKSHAGERHQAEEAHMAACTGLWGSGFLLQRVRTVSRWLSKPDVNWGNGGLLKGRAMQGCADIGGRQPGQAGPSSSGSGWHMPSGD